jgi:hypothetical protein
MAFSTILTDYLGEGLAASRPAAPNVASSALAMYFATDSGNLYAWNGATWIGVVTPTTAWNAGTVNSLGAGLLVTGTTLNTTGVFTTLSASSTVSGAGFTALFASPPSIGSTAPGTGAFTTLSATGVVTIPAATDNVGRNLFHNYMLRVQQRGAGPFTANNAYTADRWLLELTTDTDSVTMPALADADRAAIGDEAAAFSLQDVVTGNAAAGAFSEIVQRIEDVRRLSGKTITVSFWAKGSTTLNLGVWLQQNFGSGGSPSGNVNVNGQTVAITATWTRYNVQIAVPSISGKTLGSVASTSYTQVGFAFSSGATNATLLGVGVQSGTWQLWGMQCEVASVVSALEKIDYELELANCQRFFAAGTLRILGVATAGAQIIGYDQQLPITMRIAPTVTPTYTTQTNCTAGATNPDVYSFESFATATGSGQVTVAGTYVATADL